MKLRLEVDRVHPASASLALLPLFVAAGATRTEAQTKAYVAHAGANLVTVIDTATGTVAGTVPVGTGPDTSGHHPRRHPRLRDQRGVRLHLGDRHRL